MFLARQKRWRGISIPGQLRQSGWVRHRGESPQRIHPGGGGLELAWCQFHLSLQILGWPTVSLTRSLSCLVAVLEKRRYDLPSAWEALVPDSLAARDTAGRLADWLLKYTRMSSPRSSVVHLWAEVNASGTESKSPEIPSPAVFWSCKAEALKNTLSHLWEGSCGAVVWTFSNQTSMTCSLRNNFLYSVISRFKNKLK